VLPFSATVPTPLLIETDAALAEVQVKVALVPAVIEEGEAASVTVGAGGVTGGVGVAVAPPHPLNNPVAEPKTKNSRGGESRGAQVFSRLVSDGREAAEVASQPTQNCHNAPAQRAHPAVVLRMAESSRKRRTPAKACVSWRVARS